MATAASAAAAASTPIIRGGAYLDSYDARIIEFQYSIWKIQFLITHTKAILIKIRNFPNLIPLIHYVETLIGPLFNSSQGLTKRLEAIANLKPLTENKKLVIPLNTSELNYQLQDTEKIKSDYSKPHVDYRQLLLDLLGILEHGLAMYQRRLEQALLERNAHRIPSQYTVSGPFDPESVKDLLTPTEVTSMFKYVVEEKGLETFQFQKSLSFVEAIQRSLGELKKFERSLSIYKSKPNDGTLKRLSFWPYTNHRIFACYVRLADLYAILRKFGRELYLPISSSIQSSKFLQQHVSLEVALRQCDFYLANDKHNERILSKLSEATRTGVNFQLKHSTVAEYSDGLASDIGMMTKFIVALTEFVKGWETLHNKEAAPVPTTKVRSRASSVTTPVKTPVKQVEVLFNGQKETQLEKKRPSSANPEIATSTPKESILKNVETIQQPSLNRSTSLRCNRSRSGSNASLSSNSSASSIQPCNSNQSSASPSRSNSLTGSKPPIRSPNVSRSPSVNRRPASVYMSSPAFDIRTQLRRQEKAERAERAKLAASQSQMSSNSLSISEKHLSSPHVVNRRRSSSLQNPQSENSNDRSNTLLASAAGATALRQERHLSLNESSVENRKLILERQNSLRVRPRGTRFRSRSPSPLRSKTDVELPNIAEITLNDSVNITPTRQELKPSIKSMNEIVTPVNSPSFVKIPEEKLTSRSSSSSSSSTVPESLKISTTQQSPPLVEEEPDSPAVEPLPVVFSPSIKPLIKDNVDIPDISTSETPDLAETNSESSLISEPTSSPDSKSSETLEDAGKKQAKISKKVRFTGVPPLGPEPKPKRRGWSNPPKDLSIQRQGFSAVAGSIQSERMTFQRIQEREEGNSMLASVVRSGSRPPKSSKWRSLKDRFS